MEAIKWALSDAPDVPPAQVSTLLGLANHAGPDGRNAYPKVSTLVRYTRKSERSVYRDLAVLVEAGLIREGDQRVVEHLQANYRPVNYDLAIERVRGAERPKRARRKASSPDTHVSPDADVTPDTHVTPSPDTHVRSRGDTSGGLGVTPTSPPLIRNEPSLEPPLEPPPPTPSEPGGGGEPSPTVRVIVNVATAWRRPAAALARLDPAVTAALGAGWQPDALARHLADAPPDIDDAASLLRHRLDVLPAPGECGRRCCVAAPKAPVAATCITHRVTIPPGGTCEYCEITVEHGHLVAEKAAEEKRRAAENRRELLNAAAAELGPDVICALTGLRNPESKLTIAALGNWLDDHEWSLDAAREAAREVS